MKALARRAIDRYTTALDMAEDLRHFLVEQGADSAQASIQGSELPNVESAETRSRADSGTVESYSQLLHVVPKGLRSFDKHDANFFLELLPGPRDRSGLPESLRFWKTRIEEVDPEHTPSVGLIYGPSGCGKSSLVKAGLLPRLSDHVIPIFLEATPDETESRLLHGLRKRCPGLPDNLNLRDSLAALRRGSGVADGQKVLIILDQFEQWLHSNNEEIDTDLVQALRQCDGGHVQCIVMVRDDFWMAATRFMRELEIPLLEGQNSAPIDLFPTRHARRVLAAFGRAFGALPDHTSDTAEEDAKEFLKLAVDGLAEEGKVICVRLALFAEMMKGRVWTPATLKEVGGTAGVGATFLEETFSSSTAPPEHRFHQRAARAVLQMLLPDSGSDIKGQMRSYDELLAVSGYSGRRHDFDDLIKILDGEMRLITPTDPEGIEAENEAVSHVDSTKKYYQLTHDYLVHSLRQWLTRKQKETRRGRAELRLAELSALWGRSGKRTHLPSLAALLEFLWITRPATRTSSEAKMMRAAGEHFIACWLLLLSLLIPGWMIVNNAGEREQARLQRQIEGFAPTYASELQAMGHAKITVDTDPEDQLYQAMIKKQVRWLELNPAVADIFTFRRHPQGNQLIVDSETDYDRNGVYEGERESRTPIGEMWPEESPFLERAYAGETVFDVTPNTDRWGTWVGAYVPMYDRSGSVEAVFGVDFPAEDWVSSIARARRAWIVFLVVLFLVALPSAPRILGTVLDRAGLPKLAGRGVVRLKMTISVLSVFALVIPCILLLTSGAARAGLLSPGTDFIVFTLAISFPLSLASLLYVWRS